MANTYRTVSGDTWDIVSWKQYGNEKYVDVLIEANWRERFTVIFPAGVELTIPAIDTTVQNNRNLPPWRRNA